VFNYTLQSDVDDRSDRGWPEGSYTALAHPRTDSHQITTQVHGHQHHFLLPATNSI